MNAIEIKNLTKSYKGFTLDNLCLNLPKGSLLFILFFSCFHGDYP